MTERHHHKTPASTTRRWFAPVLAAGILAAAGTTAVVAFSRPTSNAAKSTPTNSTATKSTEAEAGTAGKSINAGASNPRLRTSRPIKALDFAVIGNPVNDASPSFAAPGANETTPAGPPAVGSPRSSARVRADSPVAAVTSFVNAAIAGDLETAWSLVGTADQARLGYKQRIAEQVYASGWKGFSATSTVGDSVVGTLTQTPKVSDIDGVIAAEGNLRVQTIKEGSDYRVLWSRKSVVQAYPELSVAQDGAVSSAVSDWTRSRQACDAMPANEFSGGLVGVVGLAAKLCKTTGDPVLGVVSDLEALDEPQPIIEAFGGTALQWARVVPISSPVPMSVVVAPLGTNWIIVAVARPAITKS